MQPSEKSFRSTSEYIIHIQGFDFTWYRTCTPLQGVMAKCLNAIFHKFFPHLYFDNPENPWGFLFWCAFAHTIPYTENTFSFPSG